MFENTQISWLLYIILVIISLFILFAISGYMFWNYHLGKPLAPFFWLRMRGWLDSRIALFEIFTLTNSVSLEEARREKGDGYRINTPTVVEVPKKKEGWIKRFFNYILARNVVKPSYGIEKVKRIQNIIMPKSSYSINGVNTILLWDLHPQLHTDVLEGTKILISQDIKTLDKLKEVVDNKIEAEKNLFKSYSYRTFFDLYMGTRQKYNVSVDTDNVINLIGSNFDKNYRESIEAKDFNALQAKKQEGKTIMYGYIIIAIVVIAVAFKIIYKTLYG